MVEHSNSRRRFGGKPGRAATMAEALGAIPDRSRVFVSGGAAAPSVIDRAMADERSRWSDLELVADRLVEPLAMFQFPTEPFRLVSLQPSPAVDGMRSAGALTADPVPFSRFGELMGPSGRWPIDVAIVHVSPPGPEGRFSLGVSAATPLAAIAAAPLVIAQVNPRMPYTFGDGELDRDEIDLLIDVDHPLVELTRAEPGETARRIGALVATAIPDGAMLQIGVGALADAVLAAMAGHRDIGIHSGMISDGVIDLFEGGAVTGAGHPVHPGRMVTGLLGGTRRLFDFADRNPALVTVSASVSHGRKTLRRLGRFRAVNSAVEVALDGSVNGERIGDRVISGPGGAPDYAAAASASSDGRFIVAIPATAARGGTSRIVGALDRRTPATVDGRLVTTVITENGIAEISGLSATDRADALRAIADPRFSAEL
ncbi:MAG: acetyl-CoA hydrolase/transferase family protein [Acidimicrobiales bacterium]